mgnify:CR=1 FL=1
MTAKADTGYVPYDIDLEQAVLGATLRDNDLIDTASEVLGPEHFYDPLHARMFEMINYLRTEGSVTPKILYAVMKNDPGVKETGGLTYFEALHGAAPSLPPIKEYGRILKDLAARRQLIKLGEELIAAQADGPQWETTAALTDRAADMLGEIVDGTKAGERRRPTNSVDAMHTLAQKIEAHQAGTDVHGYLTGIQFIDQHVGRMLPGDLWFDGARPGMAKSQTATNIARNVAMQGMGVDYRCPEMTLDQLSARIACEVDYDRCEAERLEPMPYRDLIQLRAKPEFVERLIFARMRVCDWAQIDLFTASMVLEEIEADSRRRARKYPGHRLLIIDHLQLVTVRDLRRGANRTEEQTIITKRLKELAKELGWTILVLSQLSREIESRDDKRPRMPDFREGGSIEQDADVVLGQVRLIRYAGEKIKQAKNEEQKAVAEAEYDKLLGVLSIAVLKNRAGGDADYHDIFIDEKSSAIRNERGASVVLEAELPF